MKPPVLNRSRWLRALAIVAIIFGLLTLIAGGRTLFNATAQQLAGDTVDFVLWFNFLAGFAYMIAGIGLWFWQRWAMWLAFSIAVATLLIFVAFGIQIWRGGSYEMRTVWAMSLRTMIWLLISAATYRQRINTQSAA